MRFSTSIQTIAMLACALGATAPAWAEPAETQSRMVSVAGLDLRSESGRAMLHHRIAVAARAVCGADEAAGVGGRVESQCLAAAEQQATARAWSVLADNRATTMTVAAR